MLFHGILSTSASRNNAHTEHVIDLSKMWKAAEDVEIVAKSSPSRKFFNNSFSSLKGNILRTTFWQLEIRVFKEEFFFIYFLISAFKKLKSFFETSMIKLVRNTTELTAILTNISVISMRH